VFVPVSATCLQQAIGIRLQQPNVYQREERIMKKYVTAGAFALFCAGAVASAQSTATQQPPQPQQPATAQAASTTVEGCVYEEKAIPGRSPNVAERAGVLEDYILVVSTASATAGTTGTSGTAGTAGATMAPKMFKLEHEDDDKLKALVGKRVQVTGKVDAERSDKTATGAPQADRSMGPDKIELPEFEVTSIAETAGECPATPAIKK
jgi:hypothetical protein